MKKLISIIAILCLLGCSAAYALTPEERGAVAAPYVPADAVFEREEYDDGLLELYYRSADNLAQYKLKLDKDNVIAQASYELFNDRGGASVVLTQEEAFAVVQKVYPDAVLVNAYTERDDGRQEYKLAFTTPALSGEYKLNAETGEVLEYTLYPVQALTGDAATAYDALSKLYPGVTIKEAEQDRDGGRTICEGKALYQNQEYEFEIDMSDGSIIQWKLDD